MKIQVQKFQMLSLGQPLDKHFYVMPTNILKGKMIENAVISW